MTDLDYLALIAGMGLVTYLPRWLPIFFLARRNPPQILVEWLDLIPAAILSALLAPALFTSGTPRHFDITSPELLTALPTFLVAIMTRSLGGTVLAGMVFYWLIDKWV